MICTQLLLSSVKAFPLTFLFIFIRGKNSLISDTLELRHLAFFFPSLFSQSSTIHEPVPTVASNTVTVPREEPDVIFYCCRPSTLNFTMLYILRCFSRQHGCNEWLSLPLLLSLNQPDHFPRTAHTNKALFSAELPLTACFLFFKAFFVNSRDAHA